MIGRRLSHYRIVGHLGTGGMGEVYVAEDTVLKRRVALKVLPSDLASNPNRLARFQREAEALAALSHPNIVTIYSVEESGGTRFLTMALIEGEPLSRQIPPDGMDLGRFFDVAVPLVDAVAAAHEHGITHRDLKPANVMVSADERLYVLDFGLAKMGVDPSSDVTMEVLQETREGTILGTVPYMSPEQVQGLPVDDRTDIFSLGVMFYQMLTGQPPFAGATQVALVSSILKDDPAAITAVRGGMPDALNRVVKRCLEKTREARYQRARDLLSDLKTARREIESGMYRGALAGADTPEHAIAVLAFQNMSSDPENEYFSDGIAEEIINALAQIDELRVAARTSSFSFKGKPVEISDIGKRLNVRHVLEGSVRRAGNRVRISAQLVEASSGYHLWSERYDRQIEDIFDVQDDIARTIVARLKVALAAGSSGRLVKAATTNMEAYQLYLKGRAMLYKRGKWIALALDCFKQAVDLDPGYAPAWAGLADAYMPLGYYGLARPHESMPKALEGARQALEVDPDCAEAHCALGGAALMWERNRELAEQEFQRAIALNPTYTQARCWYGLFFLQWTAGRLNEGVKEIRRALDADPLSSYATACYAWALTTAGRHSEAVTEARLAVQRDPDSFAARIALGHAYRYAGRLEEAIATYQAMMPIWGRNVWVLAMLALTYGHMRKSDEAAALHRELVARAATQYVQPVMLAVSASGVRDLNAAIGFCQDAADQRDPLFSLFYLNYPDFDAVRADPRFAGIVARFNQASS